MAANVPTSQPVYPQPVYAPPAYVPPPAYAAPGPASVPAAALRAGLPRRRANRFVPDAVCQPVMSSRFVRPCAPRRAVQSIPTRSTASMARVPATTGALRPQ